MKFYLLLGLALACAVGGEIVEPPRLGSMQRMERAHLEKVHAARLELAGLREPLPDLGVHHDYRAVIHVHAEDSDHTRGTRDEVLAAAKEAGVHVVMFTDHRGPKPETWHGVRDGVLFLAGSEDGKGALVFPAPADEGAASGEALRFLSHPEERLDADTAGFVGMEIVNRHTESKLDQGPMLYLLSRSVNSSEWQSVLEDFKAWPDELFGAGTDYRPEIIAKWDSALRGGRFTGIAANDAHQNVVFRETTFDPYVVSFRNLSTHILARELTESSVRDALREGRAYVAHDWLCDPTGFLFAAVNNLGVFPMGASIPRLGNTRIVARVPAPARLKLFHDGRLVEEVFGRGMTNEVASTGAYRLEAWLSIGGEERPWIYANPLFVENPALQLLRFPTMEISPEVEVRKDIPYAAGAGGEPKQRLDIYVPKGINGAPVLFFIHGGAWRSGDRAQYLPFGNRFAREGIVTVVPSYRLAPGHPHPAQIEDVAAAFAWTVREVAAYGGDTNRIFIAGHSAGGHLAALLALDDRFLQAHGTSLRMIRGVVALSGVFDLTRTEGQAKVFGIDPEVRRLASPVAHVRADAPPFLVGYCEWDYATLPVQAREFESALSKAGVSSELFFVPRESHISEMIALTEQGDPTAAAMLEFIARTRDGAARD